ncbi:hypothetical protein Slala03_58420 [Streptomyces lavendulae subsp. lavendulae]|uniref:hypothetical protein n=1 Tax=Streptomyces lavendulae TaxID=1914 RepID=UPI0024A02B39|nr:hypothetical protein [Streptomyces lavendulae]GLV86153.1 hypothetical protein Slala03_58420 [Streptomyces lavendulae subsp. lavendulae]
MSDAPAGPARPGWEPLSEDVRRCLELLLPQADGFLGGYRAQVPYARMHRGECSCPCVYLSVDAERVGPAARPADGRPVASGSLTDAQESYLGEAMLFVHDGFLADLQFCVWEDLGALEPPLWERLTPY